MVFDTHVVMATTTTTTTTAKTLTTAKTNVIIAELIFHTIFGYRYSFKG